MELSLRSICPQLRVRLCWSCHRVNPGDAVGPESWSSCYISDSLRKNALKCRPITSLHCIPRYSIPISRRHDPQEALLRSTPMFFSVTWPSTYSLSVNFSSTVYVDNGQVPRLGCNSYSLEITTTNRMRFKLWVVVGAAQIGRKSVGASVCSYMECSVEAKRLNE